MSFASRPLMAIGKYFGYDYSDVVFSPYGEHWREARKICVTQLLSSKSVDSFKDLRSQEVELMFCNIFEESNGGTTAVDLSEAFCRFSSSDAWTLLAGRRFSEEEIVGEGNITFKKLLEEITATSAVTNLGDFIPWIDWLDIQGIKRRYRKVNGVYDAFVQKLIHERMDHLSRTCGENKSRCFLDVLLSIYRKDGSSSHDVQKIKALVWDMLVGSMETTATTLEWAISLLLKHPLSMQRLQKEIDEVVGREKVKEEHLPKLRYLQCVVKESMRLYPPVPLGLAHACMDDTDICGYTVPKGTILFLNLWAIGREAAVWGEHAEPFRPERDSSVAKRLVI
eukprot:TRINITY_DN1528_c0_g1_i4.p1 TRINITY_DN1528_c0_g1~~TRINITY_DN1528_c0_g1_i4.p1  ORF type:complete len:376 (-),score=30.58 TRINITY_DN1528_c0_g1_i4:454-1467(-)